MVKRTKRKGCTNVRLSLSHDDNELLEQLQTMLQAELNISKVSKADAIKRAILETVNHRTTVNLISIL